MLGFIGTGNMACAIIRGILSSEMLKKEEIGVFDIDVEKAEKLAKEYGVNTFSDVKTLTLECDKILLAVKPNVISSVLSQISEEIEKNNPLLISIAAGKTLEFLSSCLSFKARFVRVMPNINAVAKAAVSAYCGGENVSEDDLAFAKELCESFGTAKKLKEELFPIFGVIGGCSPAFSYMYIDALARSAVKNGMPKDMALEIAAQAVLGSAKMIMDSKEHPWSLVDKVCSPGGTTIEGVTSLQSDGFEKAVTNAVEKAFQKDKKL